MPTDAGRRHRDADLARTREKGVLRLAPRFTVKTVGVTHHASYPKNLLDLQRAIFEWPSDEPCAVIFVRKPDNPHDANAVEIHVPALGDWSFIGHLPAALAARMAPELDAGVEWAGYVDNVLVSPANAEQPGVTITARRIQLEESA